jgi:Tat protein translocase TatB subunit
MFNIGPGELVAILAVALIVLGPNRLPEAVRTVGRVVGELRRISSGFQDELRHALDDSDVIDPVEPMPSANKGTEVVDSSAAALVEATASTATPAGSEELVDDDHDDFGDLDPFEQPPGGSAHTDAGGPASDPAPETVAATPGADALGPAGTTDAGGSPPVGGDQPARPTDRDLQLGEQAVAEQLASAGDAAPATSPQPAAPVETVGAADFGGVAEAGDADDERGSFEHIEALEALDPARGAEAEVADPPEVVTDVDTETDTPSDNGADAASGSSADDRRAAS